MVAMVFSAQCRLLGAGHAAPVTASRFSSSSLSSLSSSSSSSSSVSAISRPRFMRIRASSSSPPAESPPAESPPAESSDETSSSTALEKSAPEPESASIETLEIPVPAPATSMSLVSRTPQMVTPEGAAGLAQVNHYQILKIPYGSSSDEIFQAYKSRVEDVKILEKELGEEAASEQLRVLQESYDVLKSEEERKVYDWVLERYENRSMDNYIWPYQTDITQRYTNKEPVPVMRSFDQEGNNKLGLFFIGWVVISLLFGLTMNTWIPYQHYRGL